MATRMTGRESLMRQGLINDPFTQALESINLRKDANDSINNASDQYEADVADFKNTQANEFEQGLAGLLDRVGALENTPTPSFNMPDLSGFATLEDLNQGIGGINIPGAPDLSGYARLEDIPSIDTSQFLTAGDIPSIDTSQFLTAGDIPSIDTSQFLTAGDLPSFNIDDYRDDFLSIAREGVDIPEFEQPDLSGFARIEDIPSFDFDQDLFRDQLFDDITGSINIPKPPPVFDEDAFRDNLFEDIMGNIPQPPQPPQPPAFNEDELRESIYNDIIGDLPGLFEDFDFPIPGVPGDLPPMTPPTDIPGGGNPYEGIFGPGQGMFPPINFPPGFFDGIGFPPDDGGGLPPFLPPITPPNDPITPPPPVDNKPTGPINPYTGQPISNPYTPYSTESGATPLRKAISPRDFGQAPGFERPIGGPPVKPIDPPRKVPPKPPSIGGIGGGGRVYLDDELRLPPPEDIRRLKGGGGISMLPMNGQGDTLTTQVFQSGFRPRR